MRKWDYLGDLTSSDKRTRIGDRLAIYPRGKKRIFCADFWDDGKHHRISLDTCNKNVATDRALRIAADLAGGTYAPPPTPTGIDAAITKYIEYLKSEGRARKTIVRYRGELNTFRDFGAARQVHRLGQISLLLFDDYRADRRTIHAESTLFHESVVVKQFLKWCRQRKLLSINPLAEYRCVKPKREPKGGPELYQVNQILSAASEYRRTQYVMLAFSGMRSGELQHLQRIDVDLEHNWLHIVSWPGAETKTRESRKVPIHARLKPLLGAVKKSKHKWFFTAGPSNRYPGGGHWINPKKLNDDFLKILRKLGIPAGRTQDGFTVHSLRHFFKTHCINCGVPKPVVDDWQGHRIDTSVGAHYYKLSDPESQSFMTQVVFDKATTTDGSLPGGTSDD